ncbi:MAG: cytochrome c biogenesis protein CcsA [Pseudomonadota bacterium]|nr:cytochrome c biogenesis protein CcsA [Pseudomonadota bacterium]MED5430252.1 cytochrome c biogenesis protein CcsA [Pseudomonadota bacterium]
MKMLVLSGSVIVGYLLSTVYVRNMLLDKLVEDTKKFFFNLLVFFSLVLFGFYTINLIYEVNGLNFNTSLSLTLLTINALFFIFMFRKPIYHLGLILFPITVFIILITIFYKTDDMPAEFTNSSLQIHILSSFISYGFLGLAGLEAVLLSQQEKKLRDVKDSTLAISFPPIEVMEKVMFDLIVIGFALLTISILSGAPFILNEATNLQIQKIFFSLIAWITFGYLLFRRYSSGLRGVKAANLTLSGIIFLFIAYLGTKLFFEII